MHALKKQKVNEPIVEAGAWTRFELAINALIKAKPQHKTKKKPAKKRARKKS